MIDMETQAKVDAVYTQRNALAIGFAKAAIAAGWNAGRGYDDNPDKGWDPEWLHVVYVDLPDGRQVSWHMGPSVVHLLDDLPQYKGKWDGTFHGKSPEWCSFQGPVPTEPLPPYLQRMVMEAQQLLGRIESLDAYLDSEACQQLSEKRQLLLVNQLDAMAEYGRALAARLEHEQEVHDAAARSNV